MCANRSENGCLEQPDLSSPNHSKGKLPGERPRSGGRERFLPATGAIVLQLPETFLATALPAEARRRNKSSRAWATVLPAEHRRKRQGNDPGEPRKRLPPAWTVRLPNRT